MRILVLCGRSLSAEDEAVNHVSSDVEVRLRPYPVIRKGSTEVHYVTVRHDSDTDRFHGLRFDLVVEHSSFNIGRTWTEGRLLNRVRAMVLR